MDLSQIVPYQSFFRVAWMLDTYDCTWQVRIVDRIENFTIVRNVIEILGTWNKSEFYVMRKEILVFHDLSIRRLSRVFHILYTIFSDLSLSLKFSSQLLIMYTHIYVIIHDKFAYLLQILLTLRIKTLKSWKNICWKECIIRWNILRYFYTFLILTLFDFFYRCKAKQETKDLLTWMIRWSRINFRTQLNTKAKLMPNMINEKTIRIMTICWESISRDFFFCGAENKVKVTRD